MKYILVSIIGEMKNKACIANKSSINKLQNTINGKGERNGRLQRENWLCSFPVRSLRFNHFTAMSWDYEEVLYTYILKNKVERFSTKIILYL